MMKTFIPFTLATALAALVTVSTPSMAANWLFDANDLSAGATPQTVDLSTVNGNLSGPSVTVFSDSNLSFKNTAVGAAIGTATRVNGEIDTGPSVFFTFDEAVTLSELTVAWLFPDGQYGDNGDEVASFRTYDAADNVLDTFTLRATGFTTAVFSAPGVVTNLHRAEAPDDGVWRIAGLDLFGAFTKLELSGSLLTNTSGNSSGSDFSFVSARGATVVPVPAALPMFILGIGAIGLVAKRRKKRAV